MGQVDWSTSKRIVMRAYKRLGANLISECRSRPTSKNNPKIVAEAQLLDMGAHPSRGTDRTVLVVQ